MADTKEELKARIDQFLAKERQKPKAPEGFVAKGFRLPVDLVADLRSLVTELKNHGIKITETEIAAEALRAYLRRRKSIIKKKIEEKNKALP
jgi:BioD-like phosphotransacetylase family protein